jgi:geranylgeranyl diphosphate synthase type II
MYSLADCQDIINKKLSSLSLPEHPSNLYEPMRYCIDLGGKRIRPALVLMGCNLFSDKIEEALNPAIAIELFHNFTLLHDDIMDKSDMRRNKPTVHTKWNENVAILSGDAMLIKAYEYLSRGYIPRMNAILQIFNKTALEVCEGQQYDMDFEYTLKVRLNEYLRMIELKTAVLLAASLKIGALCSDSSVDNANHLYEFGRNIGLAFQLQDDLLDIYGNAELVGKQLGNDITANKKTFLLITALDLAKGQTIKDLHSWIQAREFDRNKKIQTIMAIFDELKVKETTENQINLFYTNGLNSLDAVQIDKTRKQSLYHFARYLMKREK